MAVFQIIQGRPVLPMFLLSISSGREPLVISGVGFYG